MEQENIQLVGRITKIEPRSGYSADWLPQTASPPLGKVPSYADAGMQAEKRFFFPIVSRGAHWI